MSDQDIVDIAIQVIMRCGLLAEPYIKWHERTEAERMWITFQPFWNQFQLLAWFRYKDQSPYGVADGGQNVTLLPSSLPAVNSTLSANNDTSNQQSTLFLQQSDSLYRKYNISTTPVVIAKYKLLLFTIEKTGSTVSELPRTTMCCNLHV